MKRFLFILVIAALVPCTAPGQLPAIQQRAIVLKRMVEKNHYSPRPVNDSFSLGLFKLIMDRIDEDGLLFTLPEYQQLKTYQTKLDDELNGQGWGFLDKLSVLYKQALVRADSIVNKLLSQPFDFTVTEEFHLSNSSSTNYPDNIGTLTNRWRQHLKYNILDEVYDLVSTDTLNRKSLSDGLKTLEAKTREKVKRSESKSLKRSLENAGAFTAMVNELYLDAVASTFDPHTNYFSEQGKEEFQQGLSTEGYFFGIVFEENANGQVAVKQLNPGGPAWKSGEINKGDELVSLHWEGKEVHDMTDAVLEDVYRILDQSNHDKLMFRLRKKDGTLSNVLLRKEKSENEGNIVRGFVLKAEKKIGYILLPGFYTEWENETGSSCANDVAKEILKLKKENIEGLILDVRYNGGGSLGEALEMIGIFVNEGPLLAERSRDGKLSTLKDPNRGTIYDGPLALLINGQSASASEILAASLQDYHRAVVVGSTSYGKATMQLLYPLDTSSSKHLTGDENREAVKITVGKLYRLDGSTSQLNGVKPDVQLPDAFDGLEIGERFEFHSLVADTVKRNSYYKPLPNLPGAVLVQRSTARINTDPDFQLIKKIVEEQQKDLKAPLISIPLKAELFEKWAHEQELDLEQVKGETNRAVQITVENHGFDNKLLQDEYVKERNAAVLAFLSRDIYIKEAVRVLTDLIELQKTN
jgi:carboxyl-terminal processing protease